MMLKLLQNYLNPILIHSSLIESSDPILRVIVGLYRNRFGCAPPALANINAAHSSSNSDSGIHETQFTNIPPNSPSLVNQNQSKNSYDCSYDCSYNTKQLEQQLNQCNMRQIAHKFFKIKYHSQQTDNSNSKLIKQLTNHPLNQTYLNSEAHKSINLKDNFLNNDKLEAQSMANSSKLNSDYFIKSIVSIVDKVTKTDNDLDTEISSQDVYPPTTPGEEESDDTESALFERQVSQIHSKLLSNFFYQKLYFQSNGNFKIYNSFAKSNLNRGNLMLKTIHFQCNIY
jgi:hypothetical protein